MIESTQLENEILSPVCDECHKGHFRRGETEIEFRRVYNHIITVEVHVSGVPALICNECAEELILPEVEQRIWDEFKVIEDSKEFKSLIENQKELLRRTPIKQTTQYFNMIYAAAA